MSKYIFPNNNQTNQTTYYWFKNGFDEKEIQKIKEYLENFHFEKGTTFTTSDDKSVRNSQIKWIPYNNETRWLYEKIYNYAKEANDNIFHFKLYYSLDILSVGNDLDSACCFVFSFLSLLLTFKFL